MAPLTRLRSPNHVPTDIVGEYYEQRASDGGLLITEGTLISPMALNSSEGKLIEGGIISQCTWNLEWRASRGMENNCQSRSRKGWNFVLSGWHLSKYGVNCSYGMSDDVLLLKSFPMADFHCRPLQKYSQVWDCRHLDWLKVEISVESILRQKRWMNRTWKILWRNGHMRRGWLFEQVLMASKFMVQTDIY